MSSMMKAAVFIQPGRIELADKFVGPGISTGGAIKPSQFCCLLTQQKAPAGFPTGAFYIATVDRQNRPIFATYISTVAACSTNSGIWSKFM